MWIKRELDERTHNLPLGNEIRRGCKAPLNWKAAGPDGIYNFFLKKLTSLNTYLYNVVRRICSEGKTGGE